MPNDWSEGYLPPDSLVAERIESHYPSLSTALQQFADFVLSDPMKIAQLSINDTVHATGVSVATANRFARKIGFEGYAEFRAEVIRGLESMLAPVERLRREVSEGSAVEDIVAVAMSEDIDNLRETLQGLDAARLQQAVDMLVSARRIFIAAFDNAAALGTIFAHQLSMAGKSVANIEGGGGMLSAARYIAHYDSNDLVVSIAFPRYMRDTVELTRAAQKQGISILALTDTQASPLASLGTLTLYVRARRTIGSTSNTTILGVLEALASATSTRLPGATESAQRFADFAYPWLIAPKRP